MLVYHHQVKNRAEHLARDYQDYPLDPTLPRTSETLCPRCGFTEAVYFHSDTDLGEAGMKLTFVCARREGRGGVCGYAWS